MKKIIGVAILVLTLVLTVIYRQLTHRPAAEKSKRALVPGSLRAGTLLSDLMIS
jgi:hypothetical protein